MSVPNEEAHRGVASDDGRNSRLRFWPLAVVAVAVLVFLAWTPVSIQLRLSRNGAVAQRLVESLRARFPGVNFRGAASYEREVIYISVVDHVEEAIRSEVEQVLHQEKAEHCLEPEIRLRFVGDGLDDIKF